MSESLSILVLGGGPDREREISILSADAVAQALRQAGHQVVRADITPDHLEPLATPCDVVFGILHGRWGEGGGLQKILESRGLKYVGAGPQAAATAIDKAATKRVAEKLGIPTPAWQLLGPSTPLNLPAPLVLKALTEGSSYGVYICKTPAEVQRGLAELHRHFAFGMAERFIPGKEVTVGIVGDTVLPPIQIVPAVDFYDTQAKYTRNDTRYEFDLDEPPAVIQRLKDHALAIHRGVGSRHLGRVDFIIDADHQPWFLEINTLPGFTDHSLVPKAALKIGWDMPALCDRIARLALAG